MALENKEYSVLTRSSDAKEAFAAFLEKRAPDFNRTRKSTPLHRSGRLVHAGQSLLEGE